MTLYLDTSALIKLYFEEAGTADVKAAVGSADLVATSRAAYVETFAGVGRKLREGGVEASDRTTILDDFRRDWESFFVIEVSASVCELAAKLAQKHALRTLDAIHLASASTLRARTGAETTFCGFDRRLSAAASAEGFKVNQ